MTTGFYVYAFASKKKTNDEPGTLPSNLPGIDPSYSIDTIANDGLCAFVSQVDLDEFGREALSRNLKNMEWLERKARAHDEIIRKLNEYLTIVPVRFGTIWIKPEAVDEYIMKNAYRLKSLLAKLEGAKEMGVTLHFDKTQAFSSMEKADRTIAELATKIASARPGTAHLLRKQLEKMKRDKLGEYVDSYANTIIETLGKRSLEVNKGNISSHPENPDHLYVSEAFLVSNAVLDSFLQEAANLQLNLENSGVSTNVTGPWPPYSFARIDAEPGAEDKREAS